MSSGEDVDFDDLFPDYAAECDEHLVAAGRVLLSLEEAPDRIERGQLDGLFRNFHTIKGLSAMAGVGEAERLAHLLENYLGDLRKGHTTLTQTGVELLIEGVARLEGMIAARRDHRPPPDVEHLIARLERLLSEQVATTSMGEPVPVEGPLPTAAGISTDTRTRIAAAHQRGHRVWQVTFVPTSVLAEQGISVTTVRERLLAVGEIVHAAPSVVPGGGVTFTFLVAIPADVSASAVAAPGITIEPYSLPLSGAEVSGAGRSATPLTPLNLVRVDLGRLDDLMRMVGELVITRARLDVGLGQVAPMLAAQAQRALQETSSVLERQLRELRDGVMRVRLVPVREAFARMRFVIRDLMRESKKDVDLHLTGEETEFDKYVIDRLADPLLHLVRNAIGHGIESSADRLAAGKPARGRIDLRATAAGGAVIIEVEDDGRGIDSGRVFARARAAGLVPDDGPTDSAALLDVLCTPGFSTRESADRSSGRGVGMDVVRRAVEELGGTLTLETRPGHGTRFITRLPLTLAIADALLVDVGGTTYAVPQTAVREVVQVEPGTITTLENNELLRHYQGVLPLLRLGDVFQTMRSGPSRFPALIVGEGTAAVALAADRLLGLREIVVRPLSDPLVQVPGIGGATELGDGRAVLILDTASLARVARNRRRRGA